MVWDFLKKIGLNLRIADRMLTCALKKPWIIGGKCQAKVLCAEATSYDFEKAKSGGDGEIRTPEGFHPTRAPGVRTRPLCDVSVYL